MNPTFPFSPLEIAFWTLKTPIFFRLRRAKFRRWGFIFFKISRASRGVIFFSDFDFGKVISGLYFFQISPEKCPSGLSRGGGYLQEPGIRTEFLSKYEREIWVPTDCRMFPGPLLFFFGRLRRPKVFFPSPDSPLEIHIRFLKIHVRFPPQKHPPKFSPPAVIWGHRDFTNALFPLVFCSCAAGENLSI